MLLTIAASAAQDDVIHPVVVVLHALNVGVLSGVAVR